MMTCLPMHHQAWATDYHNTVIQLQPQKHRACVGVGGRGITTCCYSLQYRVSTYSIFHGYNNIMETMVHVSDLQYHLLCVAQIVNSFR